MGEDHAMPEIATYIATRDFFVGPRFIAEGELVEVAKSDLRFRPAIQTEALVPATDEEDECPKPQANE
jgi:hypothetical protein